MMENNFELGKTYRFNGAEGDIQLHFLEENEIHYRCKVVGGIHPFAKQEKDAIRNVYKTSRILKWDYELVENGKSSGVVKRRRSKDEIAMDDFLESVLTKRKIEVLKVEIDEALISNDQSEFMKLTKELNKLQKKVTA